MAPLVTPAALAELLVHAGSVRPEGAALALRRQRVYGGGLDTVLLEMGLLDEGTLWRKLCEATGLRPLPPALIEGPLVDPDLLYDAATARRLGAVAIITEDPGRPLHVVVRVGFDEPALRARLGLRPSELFIVPEARFLALLGLFYGLPIPPRVLSLLGRLMGAAEVRRWAAVHMPPVRPQPSRPDRAGIADDSQDVETGDSDADRAGVQPGGTPPAPSAADTEAEPASATNSANATNSASTVTIDGMGEAVSAQELLRQALSAYGELYGGAQALKLAQQIAATFPADEVAQALLERAADGSQQDAGATLLAQFGDAGAPTLGRLMQDPRVEARALAATAAALARQDDAGLDGALINAALHDPDPRVHAAARRALRGRVDHPDAHPGVAGLCARLRAELSGGSGAAVRAAGLLGELRDAGAVEPLLDLLARPQGSEGERAAAHQALVLITGHDHGRTLWRWGSWWRSMRHRHRVDWLLRALASPREDRRQFAAEELATITGEYFGYHFDLPRRDREEARQRWETWWREEESNKASAKPPPARRR